MGMVKKVEKLTHSDNQVMRYIGAVTEQYKDGQKAIGEQYFDLKKEIKKINQKLDSHTEMIGDLAVDVETLKGDVKVLKDDMVVVKSDLQIIKTDVEPRVAHLESLRK